jgi:aquaporin NIP
LVFGMAVGVMIYALGHISGAHFNPAVTLGFAVARRFPKREIPTYWLAQFLAAIAAIALLSSTLPQGSDYGATIPKIPLIPALIWEEILSFLLMFVILALASDTRAHAALAGLAIGATVCLDAFIGGPITGASMNPARSLAPAIWEGQTASLWIYFLGPAIGTTLAALAYEQIR